MNVRIVSFSAGEDKSLNYVGYGQKVAKSIEKGTIEPVVKTEQDG